MSKTPINGVTESAWTAFLSRRPYDVGVPAVAIIFFPPMAVFSGSSSR